LFLEHAVLFLLLVATSSRPQKREYGAVGLLDQQAQCLRLQAATWPVEASSPSPAGVRFRSETDVSWPVEEGVLERVRPDIMTPEVSFFSYEKPPKALVNTCF
jgi:hypothetical protein